MGEDAVTERKSARTWMQVNLIPMPTLCLWPTSPFPKDSICLQLFILFLTLGMHFLIITMSWDPSCSSNLSSSPTSCTGSPRLLLSALIYPAHSSNERFYSSNTALRILETSENLDKSISPSLIVRRTSSSRTLGNPSFNNSMSMKSKLFRSNPF